MVVISLEVSDILHIPENATPYSVVGLNGLFSFHVPRYDFMQWKLCHHVMSTTDNYFTVSSVTFGDPHMLNC